MKCKSCGTKNSKKVKYCRECGEEFKREKLAAAPAPAPTIIIQDRERRGVPCFIWVLLGVILLVLLCCLLLWFNVVPIPCELRAQLPGPIAGFMEDINRNWAADCIEPQDNGWEAPQIIPDNQGQDPDPGPDDQNQDNDDDDEDTLCSEDLADTFSTVSAYSPEFSERTYVDFEFWEQPESDEYYVFILEGAYDAPERWMVEFAQENICREGSWYDDGLFHLCQDTPLQYEEGMNTFVFYDSSRDCIAGMIQNDFSCESGEYYYDQIGRCCTVGCACNISGWGFGCWQSCDPWCEEN